MASLMSKSFAQVSRPQRKAVVVRAEDAAPKAAPKKMIGPARGATVKVLRPESYWCAPPPRLAATRRDSRVAASSSLA